MFVKGLDKLLIKVYSISMITKRIQRRNQNILKYHEKGYDTRTIGKIFHLSHAQCANIIKKLKEQEKAELMDLEQRKNNKGGEL